MLKVIDFIGKMWFTVWMPGFFGIVMYAQYAECMNLVCAGL